MCATFQLSFDDIAEIKKISDEVTAKYGEDTAAQCFNKDFFPKSDVPIFGPESKISLLKWGFPMKGSKSVVFNARAESLAEKSMFKSGLDKRCLVPATSFYEWDKEKKKHRISDETRKLFYMAGIWKAYQNPEGIKEYFFTIITTAPNQQISRIHNRMPAIIQQENISVWFGDTDNALKLLKPYEEQLTIRSV
jgi:putative SOS response-associated peptidase YedK